jgi:hypothetical protein
MALRDLAIVGASVYGNADVLTAVRNGSCGADRAPQAGALAREVAEGIAEIEDYLAARSHARSPAPPSAPRPRRRRPPTDAT